MRAMDIFMGVTLCVIFLSAGYLLGAGAGLREIKNTTVALEEASNLLDECYYGTD